MTFSLMVYSSMYVTLEEGMSVKTIVFILMMVFSVSLIASDNAQFHYQLVKLIKIENKDFNHTAEDGEIYAEILYPTCKQQGKPEIDIGDYYLGPDCFYGNPQFVKVINQNKNWRIQIPICYSSHTFKFYRTVKLFCKYPDTTVDVQAANNRSPVNLITR